MKDSALIKTKPLRVRSKKRIFLIFQTVRIFILVWTIGILGAVIFWILRLTGRIRTTGFRVKNLNPKGRGIIIISNHPSLWEPIWLPFLFFPKSLFSTHFIPFSTPDKRKYYNQWWMAPLRPVFIPVDRKNKVAEGRALVAMIELVNSGGILNLFPEGGRTFMGTEFRYSESGNRIRSFKVGLDNLFLRTNALIVPIWSEGGDKVIDNTYRFDSVPKLNFGLRTAFKIGEPISLQGVPPESIISFLEEKLLALAEE